MGRRKKGSHQQHGKRKNFNRGGGKVGEAYDLGQRDNELFAKYYKGLGIVPEEEWNEFYGTLKKTLPVTFRITGYKSQSEELLNNINGKFFSNILNVNIDGEEVPPPKQLPWYPNNLAWQLDLTRKAVRSSEHLSRLHDFLVAETECGAISRQEAVSMIPPLVLDIKSHHKILDMCASPGSKTAQLIEYLHGTSPEGQLPTGYVIANDTDNKRCYLMVHQVKRLQSPCCMIVNHDGTNFPKIMANADEKNQAFHLFDRVLCDVPCSGDGTMRKNFDVWNKWHPLQGANLHGLQSKLLRRGCQLLEKNGRLVYSTCSLNPVEDEAVIAEMLRSSEGAMELIDVQHMLPGLKFSKGLSNWKVMTKTGEWIASPAEIPASMQTQYKHTIFPPTPEEAESFHLERCIRVLPHQQDTGGFFIAALQKMRHLPSSREARLEKEMAQSTSNQETSSDQGTTEMSVEVGQQEVNNREDELNCPPTQVVGGKRKGPHSDEGPHSKKKKLHGYKEDPFLFMEESDPIWPSIRDFFGLAEKFPVNQILFRSMQGKRTLYYVSEAIREITRYNEGRIKFINMGVKAFSRSPSPIVPQCDFRITQEVLGTLLANVTKRKVAVTKTDAIIAISQENPYISKLSDETQTRLHAMSPGSTVFVFTPSEKEPTPNCDVVFCGWRGKNSVRCFGSRCERSHALMLLGEDLNDINKRVEAEKKLKQEAREQANAGSKNGETALGEGGPTAMEFEEVKECGDMKEDEKMECVDEKKERGSQEKEERTDEKIEERADEKMEERTDEKMEEHTDEKMEEHTDEKKEECTDEKMEEHTDEKKEERTDEKKEERTDEKKEERTDEKKEERTDEKKEHADENIEERADEKIEERTDEKIEKRTDEKKEHADEKIEERADEKIEERTDEKKEERADEKKEERTDEKKEERADEKIAERTDEKIAELTDEKIEGHTDEKIAERTDEKIEGHTDEKKEPTNEKMKCLDEEKKEECKKAKHTDEKIEECMDEKMEECLDEKKEEHTDKIDERTDKKIEECMDEQKEEECNNQEEDHTDEKKEEECNNGKKEKERNNGKKEEERNNEGIKEKDECTKDKDECIDEKCLEVNTKV